MNGLPEDVDFTFSVDRLKAMLARRTEVGRLSGYEEAMRHAISIMHECRAEKKTDLEAFDLVYTRLGKLQEETFVKYLNSLGWNE